MRILEFFQDGDGQLSATRLAFLFVVFTVLTVWVLACYASKSFLPIDNSIIYLIGILMTGKVTQSFIEGLPQKIVQEVEQVFAKKPPIVPKRV